jgi:hypothetical protein
MYICMHACMHVSMYVCMQACVYVSMYVSVYVDMYVCMYVMSPKPRNKFQYKRMFWGICSFLCHRFITSMTPVLHEPQYEYARFLRISYLFVHKFIKPM